MDVLLMQHGVAADASVDPARPLTPTGRAEVEVVAAHAAAHGVRANRVVHSGRLRAEQSAQVLAAALGASPEQREGLGPTDSIDPVAAWLSQPGEGTVAVVGHLPFLDRLASLLVAGNPEAHVVAFCNAGLVRLVHRDGFAVAWALPPELADPIVQPSRGPDSS
jgi:phosphohistidine phosphatase